MTDYSGPERRQAALTEDKVALMIQEAVSKALAAHERVKERMRIVAACNLAALQFVHHVPSLAYTL